jgi:hypothetical protein
MACSCAQQGVLVRASLSDWVLRVRLLSWSPSAKHFRVLWLPFVCCSSCRALHSLSSRLFDANPTAAAALVLVAIPALE